MHYQRMKKHGHTEDPFKSLPPEERLLQSVIADDSGCWLWQKYLDSDGYASLKVNGKDTKAHRFSFTYFVGEIPDGLEIDHLCHVASECKGGAACRHRSCVNPSHLEPVTTLENLLRGNTPAALGARRSECHRGHPMTPENLYFDKHGRRKCRSCLRYLNRLRQGQAPMSGEFIGRWPSSLPKLTPVAA